MFLLLFVTNGFTSSIKQMIFDLRENVERMDSTTHF